MTLVILLHQRSITQTPYGFLVARLLPPIEADPKSSAPWVPPLSMRGLNADGTVVSGSADNNFGSLGALTRAGCR
jgi:hypothetical protein